MEHTEKGQHFPCSSFISRDWWESRVKVKLHQQELVTSKICKTHESQEQASYPCIFSFIVYYSVQLYSYTDLCCSLLIKRSDLSFATVVDKKKSIKTLFIKKQLKESRTWLIQFPLICFIPFCGTLEVVKLVSCFYNPPNYLW